MAFIAGATLHAVDRHGRSRCRRGRTGATQVRMELSRRDVLQLAALASVAAVPKVADAKVNIDIDRYGDKEMKVSTINRVKQNLRNAIGENPLLLPAFVQLPVMDALSFNQSTGTGGPDGAFVHEIERKENQSLADAVETIKELRARNKDDVSRADFYAFAGAVALEVTGGPRIVIQLGREDAEERDTTGIYDSFTASSNLAQLKAALERAGRDPARDAVLLHCAIQTLSKIGDKRESELKITDNEEDEDEEGLFGGSGDLTYGRIAKKRRGAVLVDSTISSLKIKGSKFDNSYVKAVVDAQKKAPATLSAFDREMVADPQCMTWLNKYASDNRGFTNAFANSFEALSLLGSKFEQAKIRDD